MRRADPSSRGVLPNVLSLGVIRCNSKINVPASYFQPIAEERMTNSICKVYGLFRKLNIS